MTSFRLLAASLALSIALGGSACAEADVTPAESRPVLVELFTSQSCSSCPPAESFFAELAGRDDLVTIEWHVDYWDDLVYGRDGRWKDPYSQAAHTRRQRAYNIALRGTTAVYTPQAVVNGLAEFVGSRRGALADAIAGADAGMAAMSVARMGSSVTVSIPAQQSEPSVIHYVRLLRQQETHVRGGENAGRRLASRNVALEAAVIGEWNGKDESSFMAPVPGAGETCAILIQKRTARGLGPVLAAHYCPDAG